MSVSAAERKHDAHMGPGDSYPVSVTGAHLQSAWDLAGHAANPDEVRRNIIAFAKEHGLTEHLPQSAKDWMKGSAKKAATAIEFAVAFKAKQEDVQGLIEAWWHHEQAEGDGYGKRTIVRFAESHNLTHLLPTEAHGMLHEMGVSHKHDGTKNDENGMHEHVVSKASVQPSALIQKAWVGEDGATYIEGWVSTPDRDLQKDIVEPEAFSDAMDTYFRVGAPVSSEHNTKSLPVGHLQRAAVIRNGAVVKSATHPDDAADFEFFPGAGNGIWGRAKLTDAKTGAAIKGGNVRGFSWIGLPTKTEPLPGGGRRFLQTTWNETTVAAYPVNQNAAILAAKAFGSPEQGE